MVFNTKPWLKKLSLDTWDHEYDLDFLSLVLYLLFVNKEQAERIHKGKDLGFQSCFEIGNDCYFMICLFVLYCDTCMYAKVALFITLSVS